MDEELEEKLYDEFFKHLDISHDISDKIDDIFDDYIDGNVKHYIFRTKKFKKLVNEFNRSSEIMDLLENLFSV